MAAVAAAYDTARSRSGAATRTGNTISMDVFGPVADNANGIGEMGYNKDSNNRELQPGDDEKVQHGARQQRTDTKAKADIASRGQVKRVPAGGILAAAMKQRRHHRGIQHHPASAPHR